MAEGGRISDGVVDRKTVIMVLKSNGVSVTASGKKPHYYAVAKGDVIEVLYLPDFAGGQVLHRLARRYDIPIYLFFNPEVKTKLVQ